MTKRERLHPEIKRLRERGMQWKDIAASVGLSIQTVHDYYTDPTGEAARARRRKSDSSEEPCSECDGTMSHSSRRRWTRCAGCRDSRLAATRAQMIELRREGLNNREIAGRLGTTAPAVGSILYRERKRDPSIPRSPHFTEERAA